ncbi:uncharacterized protein LOC118483358 [Helianthus annuus]|uniref:uncharacterized protein LOC118483358 n=1 Tax=Helianthus annuus TaxID=4232 RepID=UPI001652C7A0|nr:uncharacterized protein LOC118483358 [Helianthus annuus]
MDLTARFCFWRRVYMSMLPVVLHYMWPQMILFIRLIDMGLEASYDGFDCKIVFLEEGVDVDATGSASLFAATNDSVYQYTGKMLEEMAEFCVWGMVSGPSQGGRSSDDT